MRDYKKQKTFLHVMYHFSNGIKKYHEIKNLILKFIKSVLD